MATERTTSGTGTRRWEEEAPRYRTTWEQRYGNRGGRWEEHETAYRTGWEAANDTRYANRGWEDVEPHVRRDWESQNRRPPWSEAAEHVRDAWHQTVELREERLRPVKEEHEAGAVTLRKDVITEQRSVDVPVTHEEVVIERRPVERRPAHGEIGTGEDEIRVPLEAERVRLEKDTVVTEEIGLGKRPVTETERLQGTVRKEELHMEREGDVEVHGDTTKRPPTRR
jgi:uncharacterized protein (TIGR02271 family)